MRRLVAAIVGLIRSWLAIDRIRSGQSLKQLTAVEIGETIFVDGEPAVVVKRWGIRGPGGGVMTIDCSTENGPATLRVEYQPAERGPLLTWERARVLSPIRFDDIVIPQR